MKPKEDEWEESVQKLGKTIELYKNGILWSCNVIAIRVAIAPENHPRDRIGYGFDLLHHQVIIYVGHTIIQYGCHGYIWPDFLEKETHMDMNPWPKFGGTQM